MKKKNISFFVLFIVLIFAGCSKTEEVYVTPISDAFEEVSVSEKYDSENAVSETENKIENEIKVEAEEEDPLAMLEVSEEWARNKKGRYLLRGDKYYSLIGILDTAKSQKYNVGWRNGYSGGAVGYMSFKISNSPNASDFRPRYVGSLSIGDISVPTLEKDDKIVSFGSTTLRLYRVQSDTYSVNVWDSDGSMYLMTEDDYDVNKIPMITSVNIDTLTITDENGNAVEDIRDLEYEKKYIVSGFKGTDYVEKEMVADSSCYVVDREDSIELEGELDKSSYAVYDFSNIPSPGLYAIGDGSGGDMYGFLRIK